MSRLAWVPDAEDYTSWHRPCGARRMTAVEKPPVPGQPGFVSYIPDSAPFSPEQRDWLNGFFAGFLATEGATPPPLPAAADPAFRDPMAPDPMVGEDDH